MKAKVNPMTGMVALVAIGDLILNVKKGNIFGRLPKDAAPLLAKKHAALVDDEYLPELPKGMKWNTVDINIEQAVAGDVEEDPSDNEGDDPKEPVGKSPEKVDVPKGQTAATSKS